MKRTELITFRSIKTYRMEWLAIGVALSLIGLGGIAQASPIVPSLSVTYFAVNPMDSDFHDPSGGPFPVVAIGSTLGPNGLPVVSGNFGLTDVMGTGEITWWSPAFNVNVLETCTGTVTLPYTNLALYSPAPCAQDIYDHLGPPPSNPAAGFVPGAIMTARYDGSLFLSANKRIVLGVSVDDHFLLYIDGVLEAEHRGGGASAEVLVDVLSFHGLTAGSHTIEAFFVDRAKGGAGLAFDIEGRDGSPSPTPEPSSLVLFGIGLIAISILGWIRRRYDAGLREVNLRLCTANGPRDGSEHPGGG